MDFLDSSNISGQTLLRLASRGNAIIAELVRLSEHIPAIFKLDDKAQQKKYADIILDFNYVGRADYYENKIENSPVSATYNANNTVIKYSCIVGGSRSTPNAAIVAPFARI
jgi:hypothetical protein